MISKKRLDELKGKYDSKKINQIEKEIKDSNELSLEARKTSIFALAYLKHSSRYKENPVYKKSSFANYLLGRYNIRYNTFDESFRSFDKFEAESIKYGVGLVAKVSRICGTKKQKQVLDEINQTSKSLKNPIQKAKIETIIDKYAKPKTATKPSYKALYAAEVKQHDITKMRYKEVSQALKEAKAQIEKLKATVLELRPLREMKKAMLPFISESKMTEHRVG